ncbi:helix-turn-helix domain-containing protein [Mycobacterium marseillense]|uniref:AraC-like ligand-binding domain-containing protein n=1 Tax=Mycobacterium marseillense TaxID=701042 RepID=UPI001F4F7FE8|nr:helix-turn-helix domain-containing protein [Mycobacterium marseillense]
MAAQRDLTHAVVSESGDLQPGGHGSARERFDAFRQIIEDLFVPLVLRIDEVGSFRGYARVAGLGPIHVTEVAVGGGIVMSRTAKMIERKAPQYLKVNLLSRGTCTIAQDDRAATLGPGDFIIYDTTRPFHIASTDAFHMYGVIVPTALLRLPDSRLSSLKVRRISGREGMGAIVSQFVTEVGGRLARGAHTDNIHLADAILDLLMASFAEQLSHHYGIGSDTGRRGLLVRIHAFIDSRLNDPELNSATIAAAHYISVRHLQKLFEEEGQTVAGWIRSRRIEHCRKDLSNVELAHVAVGDICHRWGFGDAASFSKVFKAVHGLAPRDYRSLALSARRK